MKLSQVKLDTQFFKRFMPRGAGIALVPLDKSIRDAPAVILPLAQQHKGILEYEQGDPDGRLTIADPITLRASAAFNPLVRKRAELRAAARTIYKKIFSG